jgi:hypothetical protein
MVYALSPLRIHLPYSIAMSQTSVLDSACPRQPIIPDNWHELRIVSALPAFSLRGAIIPTGIKEKDSGFSNFSHSTTWRL